MHRIQKGGDMYENYNKFLLFASNYDIAKGNIRSFKKDMEWIRNQCTNLINIDGRKTIDEIILEILFNS